MQKNIPEEFYVRTRHERQAASRSFPSLSVEGRRMFNSKNLRGNVDEMKTKVLRAAMDRYCFYKTEEQ